MWLYSITFLTAGLACVAYSSAQLNTKRRSKQDGNRIAAASHRRRYRPLADDDTEAVQVPMKIPKLSRAQKIALIIASGQDPYEKQRYHARRRKGKRRSRNLRHVQNHYHNNPYFFADDGDDEIRWNEEVSRAAVWDQQQQQPQESNGIENPTWESETETTVEAPTGYEPEWGGTAGPYDAAGSYWDTSSPSYSETLRQESTTPSYWDTSTPAFWDTATPWETSPDADSYWPQEQPEETGATDLEPTTTTAATTRTTGAPLSDRMPALGITEEPAWRRLPVVTPTPSPEPTQPLALPMANCPHRFDAVTRAFNGRTYIFARDRVYQLWRRDNLHQKASFYVNEMFPHGPRTVTVAYTNQRSGVTVLIEHQTVYRYRWDREKKVFYLARKSPQSLVKNNMPVYPRAGFQWIDGNQVLVEGDNFATYDAYWNVATFSGNTADYFPQFPRDLIGMTYQNDTLFILYTASNKIQIYDTGKYRVLQEYPIAIGDFVGCSRG